jgi:hypothetical protein
MSLKETHVSTDRKSWLPVLVGVAVGVVIAGAPMYYINQQIKDQVSQLDAQSAKDMDTIAELRATIHNQQVVGEAHDQQLAKPDLPLELSFRPKLFAGSGVLFLHIRNASHSVVAASMSTMRSGIPTQQRVFEFPPDREVILNTTPFTSGDTVTLTSPDYRQMVASVR